MFHVSPLPQHSKHLSDSTESEPTTHQAFHRDFLSQLLSVLRTAPLSVPSMRSSMSVTLLIFHRRRSLPYLNAADRTNTLRMLVTSVRWCGMVKRCFIGTKGDERRVQIRVRFGRSSPDFFRTQFYIQVLPLWRVPKLYARHETPPKSVTPGLLPGKSSTTATCM